MGDFGCVHLGDQVWNRMGLRFAAAPQQLGNGFETHITKIRRGEISVDIHVEVEHRLGVVFFPVEQMQGAFVTRLQVDARCKEECHAQVRMDIQYRRQVGGDASQRPRVIQFEIRQVGKAEIALVTLIAERTFSCLLSVAYALVIKGEGVGLGVAGRFSATRGDRERRCGKSGQEFSALQVHVGSSIRFAKRLGRGPM